MKLIFAGTPPFAATALESILHAGHEVVLVLTQPDRAAGRGMKLRPSAVKQLALAHNIPLLQPTSLNINGKYSDQALRAQQLITDLVSAAQVKAMVVAAYGLLLPQWLLELMQSTPSMLGCLNIHASLLPRWRGAAPIHRAIEAGDSHSGVCIMQMDAGLDTGAILMQEKIALATDETTASLHDKLATLGADLIVAALANYWQLSACPQPDNGITYASKISKTEAKINWHEDAATICRKIRAFNPFPGAFTTLEQQLIKIWAATAAKPPKTAAPGTINITDKSELIVNCGPDGSQAVTIMQLQKAGGKKIGSTQFINGINSQKITKFD